MEDWKRQLEISNEQLAIEVSCGRLTWIPHQVRDNTATQYLSKSAKISIAIFDQTLRFEARIKKRNRAVYVAVRCT